MRVRCCQPTGLPKGDSMTDTMSFAEVAGQHAELLPARTVLSLFNAGGCGNGGGGHDGGDGGDGGGRGGNGGYGGDGGAGRGGLGFNLLNNHLFGDPTPTAG